MRPRRTTYSTRADRIGLLDVGKHSGLPARVVVQGTRSGDPHGSAGDALEQSAWEHTAPIEQELRVDADGPAPDRPRVGEGLLDSGGEAPRRAGDAPDPVARPTEAEVHRRVRPARVLRRGGELEDVGLEGAGRRSPTRQDRTGRSRGRATRPIARGRPWRPSRRRWPASHGWHPGSTRARCDREPAARIDGSSAFVSRTGPNRLVEKICCHTSTGISSTLPTAATPALCTRPSGEPTRSMISDRRRADRRLVVEVEPDGISRGSPSTAPASARRPERSRSGIAHRRQHRPPGAVEVRGGR